MSKFIFAVSLLCVILQLAVRIEAACVCHEPGTDHCAPCNERQIVRPKQKHYEVPISLPPIGDNCWCNKQLITPAALPKPCEKHNTPHCKCKKEKAYYGHEGGYGNPPPPPPPPSPPSSYVAAVASISPAPLPPPVYDSPPPVYDSPPPACNHIPPVYNNPPADYYTPAKHKDDSLPADPVSVSLAVQAVKAIGVPEAKLAFGFVQQPVDGLQKIQFSNIPEENLFQLKNDVITLKKKYQPVAKKDEEIYIEEEEDEEGPADDVENPHLTYKQLGYETEEFKNPLFRKVASSYAYGYDNNVDGYRPSYKPVYAKTKVDCGFRPGNIVPYPKPGCRSGHCY